jgi:hypothetical protein
MSSITKPANGRKTNSSPTTVDSDAQASKQASVTGLTPPLAPADPFDPARLRLTQDFTSAGVKKAILTVPVRKPAKEWFVRTHPNPDYSIDTYVLDLKEDRELYLVERDLWSALSAESTFGPRQLVTTISRQGTLFVWPFRLPGPDGKLDDWNRTALEAAQRARAKWLRIASNISAGHYDVFEATADIHAPDWPELSFQQILKLAFKDHFINSLDHPVLKRLRGEQ